MHAVTLQEALEYGKKDHKALHEVLKWELPSGSNRKRMESKRNLLIGMANHWGFQDDPEFNELTYKKLMQENTDRYSRFQTLEKYSVSIDKSFVPSKEGMQKELAEQREKEKLRKPAPLINQKTKKNEEAEEDLNDFEDLLNEFSYMFLQAEEPKQSDSIQFKQQIDPNKRALPKFQEKKRLDELIGEELGRGAGGIVYKYAPDPNFVVKIFHNKEGYLKEKKMHKKLVRRSKENQLLSNSLCLACHHCDESKALLLPCLDTSNELEKLLSSNKVFRLSECNELAQKLEVILTALHNSGVIHGDFKAKNIIITKNGPVVIDFGLSQRIREELKNDQLELDIKQFLWIIFQLRFHLPYKTEGNVFGLMVENPDQKQEDLRWDLQPVIYGLAGSKFDDVSYEVSESIKEFGLASRKVWYTMKAVNQVRNEIFNSTEISNFSIGSHAFSEFKRIQEICQLLDKNYKDITSYDNVTECYQVVVKTIRKQLSNVIPVRTTRIRLLLSLHAEHFSKSCEDEKESINSNFGEAREMFRGMCHEIDEARKQDSFWTHS